MIKWILGEEKLSAKANKNVDIDVYFTGSNPTHIHIDGNEFDAGQEWLDGVYVGFGDQVCSLKNVIAQAAADYPDLLQEDENDSSEYSSHIASLSAMNRYI